MAMGSATTAGRRPGSHGGGLTLREALRDTRWGLSWWRRLGRLPTPAVARMGPVASGAQERYLDAALDEARAGGRSAA